MTPWDKLTEEEKVLAETKVSEWVSGWEKEDGHEMRRCDHLRGSIGRYVTHGIPVGDFLFGALSNDFTQAATRADSGNAMILPEVARLLYNFIPRMSRGSTERVNNWLTIGGLRGWIAQEILSSREEDGEGEPLVEGSEPFPDGTVRDNY